MISTHDPRASASVAPAAFVTVAFMSKLVDDGPPITCAQTSRDADAGSGTLGSTTLAVASITVVVPAALVTANVVVALARAAHTAYQLASGSSKATLISGSPDNDGVTMAGVTIKANWTLATDGAGFLIGSSQLHGTFCQQIMPT